LSHDGLFWHSARGGIFTFAFRGLFSCANRRRIGLQRLSGHFRRVRRGLRQALIAWRPQGSAGNRSPLAMQFAMPSVENIFLLNPPFSGSTAMADLLLKSPITWSAWSNGEGQWVEEVTQEMRRDPWNPALDFDWERIRAAWLERKPADKRIMIEKSPPNLLRVRSILETFPNSIFVVSNRDPYAWLGGVLRHEGYRGEIRNPNRRREIVRYEISQWVFRSQVQIENIRILRGRSVITRYQEFCGSPDLFLQNLYNYCGDLRIDARAPLKVKSYPVQGVVNMNDRQVSRLTSDDIATANRVLIDAKQVLEFFGYHLMDRKTRSATMLTRLPQPLLRIMRGGD
jgi:Sulfotransferase family